MLLVYCAATRAGWKPVFQVCESGIVRTLYQDLIFGLRLLRQSPAFTVVAVLTLALGIAANTTVFSWIDGLLLHPYPGAANGQELAVLEGSSEAAPNGANQISWLDYHDYRDNLRSISGLALHREDVFSLGEGTHTQAVWGELVSGNYFAVLGVKPVLGRVFTAEEDGDKLGAYPVAVISDRLFRRRFQGDPAVLGKPFRVNRQELTLVGVAPPEFRGTMPGLAFDIWVPATMAVSLGMLDVRAFRYRGDHEFYAVTRLKPGVAVSQANAEAVAFSHSLAATYRDSNRGVSATILPVWRFHSAAPELLLGPLRILMAIAALVFLIVCANIANLLLARSVARQRELGIRVALGAGAARLSRQLFTETFLLAAAGALVAFPLAILMGDQLPGLVPKINAPVAAGFQMSGRVLVFTMLAGVAATLVCGAAPLLFWFRSDVNEVLKEGGRSGGSSAHSHRLRSMLVISEVALASVALIGAGLFLRSFHNARAIDPGFDRNHVVLARFYLSTTGFSTRDMLDFCRRLQARLRAAPGITNAAYADYAPLGSSAGPYDEVRPEGYVPAPNESREVNNYQISEGFFGLLRIPLLEGREFRDTDDRTSPPVMIVNQSFARRYFHGENPVGRRVRFWDRWSTVIGLVRDSKYFNIAEAPRPHFFVPFRQTAGTDGQLFFFVKAAASPAAVMGELRGEVAGVDPNAVAFDAMSLTDWTEVTLLPQKVAASMLAALGLISLVLAAVGLYSVMAYAVIQRTQEIGIRMALGALPGDVLRDVLRRGLLLTITGLALGLAAAFALARLVAAMLVHVSAADPLTFGGAALFLMLVALVASYVPARRATKVDPMVALRCE
jgi:putative ABC transport system permease protein